MKVAVAQSRPTIGSLANNIDQHIALVKIAAKHAATLVVFPELSLTGYEPSRALELCCTADGAAFTTLQKLSDHTGCSIAVGFPLKTMGLPNIAAKVIRPHLPSWIYSKQFLHKDEVPYFSPGPLTDPIIQQSPNIALAICYELSVAEHARLAFQRGATGYIASAAKTESGVENACRRLQQIAIEHSAFVMFANSLGQQDGDQCVGQSAVWWRDGTLLAQLDSEHEGIIVVDDQTSESTVEILTGK